MYLEFGKGWILSAHLKGKCLVQKTTGDPAEKGDNLTRDPARTFIQNDKKYIPWVSFCDTFGTKMS